MSILNDARHFILSLDRREFYKYFLIFWLIFLAILGLLLYNHYSSIGYLQKRIRGLNHQRERARVILQNNEKVKKDQEAAESILSQEPNFKIKNYFEDILKELRLDAHLSRETDIAQTDLGNGYTEIRLGALFSQLNMKQVTELLYKIKQNYRVYTKELKIVKNVKSPTIDVTLVVATLEAQRTTI